MLRGAPTINAYEQVSKRDKKKKKRQRRDRGDDIGADSVPADLDIVTEEQNAEKSGSGEGRRKKRRRRQASDEIAQDDYKVAKSDAPALPEGIDDPYNVEPATQQPVNQYDEN